MYTFSTDENFEREFKKLDKTVRVMITQWIKKHLMDCDNPRAFGKALVGNLKGYWRYRIGNYRLLAIIKDDELIIVAIEIEHRKSVYKRK
ncbi:MAG: type II toxin-antitoxin system RelE/ParE family toxin [Selenomonas massiliensis]|uniref:type II toxin-antitoxin system RelE family toxin n=1 Tax=Selenomonas massiliensis TaxID=2058293 RepID=UPI000D10B8B1|nr:type II toxin-antitoxin system RelE/ParE family toxin [Selenomonas massiliensis]